MSEPITSFTGEHRFLSNFYPAHVRLDGRKYRTVEHAYQAAKTLDLNERAIFSTATLTPGMAKRMGRRLTIRPNWDEVKLVVMEALLRQKFKLDMRDLLVATRPCELIEGNTWGDTFWGQCPVGHGDNHLGRLLMKIRDEL